MQGNGYRSKTPPAKRAAQMHYHLVRGRGQHQVVPLSRGGNRYDSVAPRPITTRPDVTIVGPEHVWHPTYRWESMPLSLVITSPKAGYHPIE